MKTIKKQTRLITLILALATFLHSCAAYRHTPSSIDEIVQSNSRVLVIAKDGSRHKFKRIVKMGDLYYGVKSLKNSKRDVLIYPNNIKKLKAFEPNVSMLLTLIGTVLLGAIVVVCSLGGLSSPII